MKIKAISDTHGNINLLEPDGADVVLVSGDIAPIHNLSNWGKADQLKWMKNVFCAFVRKNKDVDFVFIAGNHDFWGATIINGKGWFPSNAHYLRDSEITLKGLKIYGTPWVPEFGRRWAFEASKDTLSRQFSQIPRNVDFLLTHTPPRIEDATVDVVNQFFESEHLGSKELAYAILDKQPKVSLFGHIHSGDHTKTMIGNTECYNVSILDEHYYATYEPKFFDV